MTRPTRTTETRSATSRKAEKRAMPTTSDTTVTWIDRSQIPDGMDYYWVRESVLGQRDDSRVQYMMMNGWRPVPADRHPDWVAPLLPDRQEAPSTVIRRGGLILMECPLRDIEARREDLHDENRSILQDIAWATGDGALSEDVRMVQRNETSIEQVRQTFKED